MAGCPYKYPNKANVIHEMKRAFNTLDCYLDTHPEGSKEPVPDIFMQLLNYINSEIAKRKGLENG